MIPSQSAIYKYLSEVERVYNKRELPKLKTSVGTSKGSEKKKLQRKERLE